MSSKFTERDTEKFYDSEDKIYQRFWDKEGSLHWGYFKKKDSSFLQASENLTNMMVRKSKINSNSYVLDVGCGNGFVDIYIARKSGCKISGIDLSGVRIQNALDKLKQTSKNIREKIDFKKASATNLPFKNNSFSHVFCQATIYHVHDKEKALSEIYRVLKNGGNFIFDDLLKPKQSISQESQKHVYDRLLFDTPFSFESYKEKLKEIGFSILYSKDISQHLKRSYEELITILENKIRDTNNEKLNKEFQKLIVSYKFMVKAVDNNELGWGLYLCKK